MRAMAVVVPGVAAKDAPKMTFVDDEQMIEALRSDGADEALRVGVRVRRPEWGLQDLGTFRQKDRVEACHVLRVAVANEELDVDPFVGNVTSHIPGLLSDPGRVWMSGHAGDPDPSAADFDEEENVKTLQQHRVHAKEVCGHDVRALGLDGLPPRGSPARCWSEVVIEEDPGHGAGGQPDAKLQELALDAPIAHRGFFLAKRTTRDVVCSSTLGRPGRRCG